MDIFSSLPGGTYGPNQGTSMAGPHVAGAVALLWSADPALIGDMDRTEQILRQSARPHRIAPGPENGECDDGPAPNNGVGYGLLDVYANFSLDGGATWQPADYRLDSTAMPGTSDSVRPFAYVGGGAVHVVWVDHRSGRNGDIYYRRLD